MTDSQQIHRADSTLRRAIRPGPDDFAHPDHEDLIAYAEECLGDVDRETVQAHIVGCAQCAEDVRDIAEMRDEMRPTRSAPTGRLKYAVAALAGIAALLTVAILLRRPTAPVSEKEASAGSALSASPRETALSAEQQALVAAATASGRVDVPADVRALAGSVGQLLGRDASPAAMLPMSPSGTAVASATPQFFWTPIAGAVSYRVAVFDAAFREIASSGPQAFASAASAGPMSWTPSMPLPTGVSLAWQVTAHMADKSDVIAPAPPRPEAQFIVLDAAAAAGISDLRARLSDQPIALGILLAKAGLVDDAAREFDRAAATPSTADLAAKLRASLRAVQ